MEPGEKAEVQRGVLADRGKRWKFDAEFWWTRREGGSSAESSGGPGKKGEVFPQSLFSEKSDLEKIFFFPTVGLHAY